MINTAPTERSHLPMDFVPERCYPDKCTGGYWRWTSMRIPRGSQDPPDYPAYGDDDEDEDKDKDEEEEEEEHPALADSVPPVHRMTTRISIQDEPSISLPPREEVEKLLALTTLPPSPLTPLSSPLPNSPTHIEIPESCLPLRKRVRFASPTVSHEVGESSAVGAARQDRPIIARDDPYSIVREDLYGFVDVVDVPPR
ncbi:hypothetical protein Tco_1299122, partial [Tanacetum coccineum]